MSTTIEEIDNIQEESEDIEFEELESLDELIQPPTPVQPQKENELKSVNEMIMDILYKKLKEPVLVTVLVIIFTHPLLIKLIFNIPYIEVVEKTISINIVLAISTGIAFFLLREII